ncbi:protein DpdG [Pseudomonadales bacterium]|nr:protein DpdG [Pseudomonadales bacterium]
MSFINNAHPGSQINLLCLIFRVLSRSPNKYTAKELQEYCAPESLFSKDDHKKRFKDTLNFWSQPSHRLWEEDTNEKLFLSLPVEFTGDTPADVAHQLRHLLMKAEFSDIMADDDEQGASKAIRSFAFILTQDQFTIFKETLTRDNVDGSFASDFGQYSLNDSEKSYFIEFCNFIGLSENIAGNEHIDPTRLIISFLGDIFSGEKVLSASDFVSQLSENVPIIDNGRHNRVVREAVGAEIDMPNSLSVNLSHALNRLHEARVLMFSTLSDDVNAVTLNYPNDQSEQISSVELVGGSH